MKGAIAAIAGLLLAVLIPGVAGANSVPSQVQLDSNALFINETDPATSVINVQADVKCAGVATLTVTVDQPAPPAAGVTPAHGEGSLTFICRGDGSSQRVAVTIDITVGVFNLGDAMAKADLWASQSGYLNPDRADDQRIINIRYR